MVKIPFPYNLDSRLEVFDQATKDLPWTPSVRVLGYEAYTFASNCDHCGCLLWKKPAIAVSLVGPPEPFLGGPSKLVLCQDEDACVYRAAVRSIDA